MHDDPLHLDIRAVLTTALASRYVIAREIGRGGMATVFLADDLKHQRRVALKVLRPELGALLGVERFLSEIRVTANLQHPNLLPLFDSGEADGLLYYVMPFVDGETLRARLDREQQLPVSEAIRIARAMAGALDYAHERGVIHRDLKPENVLIQAGQPVIADFGIALAVAQAGGRRVTETGIGLGTPQYMSPEQATGERHIDGRADLYALGAMTYEMLAGEPPHVGHSAQAILAKLMTEEVRPLTVLRRSVPLAVDAAVRRALEKLPADRFATAGAFASALGDGVVTAERSVALTASHAPRVNRLLAAFALLMAVVAGWSLGRSHVAFSGSGAERVLRYVVKVDPDGKHALGTAEQLAFGRPSTNALALSPDGTRIVYAAWDSVGGGQYLSHLYMRQMGDERAQELSGTEGAGNPSFSPDGQWVAFTNGTGLARRRLDGGDVQSVTPARGACCLSWGMNDTLLFADSTYHLRQVAAAGGGSAALPVSVPGSDSETRYLQPLPSVGSVLFHVRLGRDADSSAIYRLDKASGKMDRLLSNAADPKVLAHSYLLFMRRGTLMAVRFNEATGTVNGEPVMVVDDVMHAVSVPTRENPLGIGQYAVSSRGDLIYARGGVFETALHDLIQVHPDGLTNAIAIGLPMAFAPSISPSGEQVAFSAALTRRGDESALWVHDLRRHITTKVMQGGLWPQWNADGRTLAASYRQAHGEPVFVVAANGSDSVRRVVSSSTTLDLTSWSRSGVFAGVVHGDIWTARIGEVARPFFTSPEIERFATFSPDGRWIAYSATKGIREEVYVRPYPGPEPVVQISTDGGRAPAWARDGRSLYFLSNASPPAMMRAAVSAGTVLSVAPPTVVLKQWPYASSSPGRSYDVFPDGSFLGVTAQGGSSLPAIQSHNKVAEFHVVLNFLQELRTRVK